MTDSETSMTILTAEHETDEDYQFLCQMLNLAITAADVGHHEIADEFLNKFRILRPTYPRILLSKIMAKVYSGQYEQAIKYIEEYHRCYQEGNDNANVFLVLSYAKLKYMGHARHLYDTLLQSKAISHEAQALIRVTDLESHF